jgi:NAD+ diphosphatase
MAGVNFCPMCGQSLSLKKIEGREYQACAAENCNFVFWDNPLPVVAAIVEYQGNVLLARNRDWAQKIYGLITGFLEKGESPEKAVLREVKEELDLEAELVGMIGVYPFFDRNQLILAYHVVARGRITLGEELVEVIHVPPEKLRPWQFGTGLAVRDWLEKRKVIPFH